MPITLRRTDQMQMVPDTIGGVTYYLNGRPFCLRIVADEASKYCSQAAGYGTDHTGEGRCKFHSGNVGRPAEHGRYAEVAKRKLRRDYEKHANDPRLLDLTPELALQRTLLERLLKDWQDDEYSPALLNKITDLIGDVTSTVNRIEKIQSQQVLTRAAARLIMIKAMEIAQRFIPDKDVPLFVDEWQSRVIDGGLLLEGDASDDVQ